MARPRSPRLHTVSYAGPRPELELGPEDWLVLEAAYGRQFEADVRQELLAICNRHLFDQKIENEAEPRDDVIKFAQSARKAATPLWSFLASGLAVDHGDAYSEFEFQLEEFLGSHSISIPQGALVKLQDGEDGKPEWTDLAVEPGTGLRVSSHLAMMVVSHVVEALDKVAKGHGMIDAGFQQGRAFESFLLRMRDWAEGHNWRKKAEKASNGIDAGPISHLIFELTKRFPAELRTPIASPNAAADQLKKARKKRRDASVERSAAEDGVDGELDGGE